MAVNAMGLESRPTLNALLPANVIKRWTFKNLPHPCGVADVSPNDMIDLDECGLFVEHAQPGHGKACVGCRVRDAGPCNHSTKFTLTVATEGGANGGRWRQLDQKAGARPPHSSQAEASA